MALLPATPAAAILQTMQLALMDEESTDLFWQVMKKMMEQTGKETD